MTKKIPKWKAGYGENPAGFKCGVCQFFQKKTGECSIVEGDIKARACCNIFNSPTYKPAKKPGGK